MSSMLLYKQTSVAHKMNVGKKKGGQKWDYPLHS